MSNGSLITSAAESSSPSRPAQIGPNALIQTVHVLRDEYGAARADEVLRQGGQAHLIDELPSEMVDEQAFYDLAVLLVEQFGPDRAHAMLQQSGERTAHYLLAHRIPRPFQRLLGVVPRRVGLWLLLTAISQHAWTFAGSGVFRFTVRRQPRLMVLGQRAVPEVVSGFYGGTFAALLQALIAPQTRLQERVYHEDGRLCCEYVVRFT